MENIKQYYVEIIETDTGKVVKRLGPLTEGRADKIHDGMLINLNHDKYHIDIVDESQEIGS